MVSDPCEEEDQRVESHKNVGVPAQTVFIKPL